MTRVTTDDWVAISDLIGRYNWYVDEGMAEEYAGLWAEDGVFTGVSPEPIVGREGLAFMTTETFRQTQGSMRHIAGNIHVDYDGDDHDRAKAKIYNYVSVWGEPPSNFTLALSQFTLARVDGSWQIKRNDTKLLRPPLSGLEKK